MAAACAAAVWAVAFGGLAAAVARLPEAGLAAAALAGAALAGAAAGAVAVLRLRSWPRARLGLFRDRLVIIEGRREMRAPWTGIEAVTLAATERWPRLTLTDRLTVHLRHEPALTFKPAAFGLAPTACRDLVARLRDDPGLRARLPEFDSLRDLAISPVVAGELIEPRL